MIKIVNKHFTKIAGIYIGRPSLLGNPFVIGKDGTRTQVIAKYKKYITNILKSKNPTDVQTLIIKEIDYLAKRAKTEDVVLVCYCKPEPCHGDVLKKIIEERKHV